MIDLPRVRFRYDMCVSSETRTRILEVYGDRLADLMKRTFSTRLNSLDYEDLPALRLVVAGAPKFQDLSTRCFAVMEGTAFKLLFDAAPAYNAFPADFQAYVLLALGVRSRHLTTEKTET